MAAIGGPDKQSEGRVFPRSRIALAYRVAFLGVAGYGILLYLGVFAGRFRPSVFLYYTMLSVSLSWSYFGLTVAKILRGLGGRGSDAPPFPHFKGGVTMAVAITMIVYHFLLAPIAFDMAGYRPYTLSDLVIHYAVPVMVILDWLLFDKKPTYVWTDPIKWLAIPLAYFLFALIRARFGGPLRATGSRYPYYFIDIDRLGIRAVALNALLMAAGFAAIGYAIVFVDRIKFLASVTKTPKDNAR